MSLYDLSQQLNFKSPPKRTCHEDKTGSPMGTPTKRAGSPMGTPTKRAGSPMGTPTKRAGSPMGTPTKRAGSDMNSPSKKPHTPYSGNGSFTPMVEKPAEDDGMTVIKTVYVYPRGINQLVKRKFELDNPKIRPISYEDYLAIKKSHEMTDVPNVVHTFPITETANSGILECQIKMQRVRTLFEVLPKLTLKERLLLSRKLWKALSEINAYLAKEGLCLNDPALNWGLDEEGNIKFFDLLFSKKMTMAAAFKFFYDGQVPLSPEDEKKIVQLRAFVLMVLFVENFEDTSCRLNFEILVRKLCFENKVCDMSIADLESFLNSYL